MTDLKKYKLKGFTQNGDRFVCSMSTPENESQLTIYSTINGEVYRIEDKEGNALEGKILNQNYPAALVQYETSLAQQQLSRPIKCQEVPCSVFFETGDAKYMFNVIGQDASMLRGTNPDGVKIEITNNPIVDFTYDKTRESYNSAKKTPAFEDAGLTLNDIFEGEVIGMHIGPNKYHRNSALLDVKTKKGTVNLWAFYNKQGELAQDYSIRYGSEDMKDISETSLKKFLKQTVDKNLTKLVEAYIKESQPSNVKVSTQNNGRQKIEVKCNPRQYSCDHKISCDKLGYFQSNHKLGNIKVTLHKPPKEVPQINKLKLEVQKDINYKQQQESEELSPESEATIQISEPQEAVSPEAETTTQTHEKPLETILVDPKPIGTFQNVGLSTAGMIGSLVLGYALCKYLNKKLR